MPRLAAYLLGAAIALVSCSQTKSVQTAADAGKNRSALQNRFPPADPAKYRSVVDAREWQNPYLMVHAKGIDARPINAATETPTMAPADVIPYLEKLPSIAWPYGLVVAVQENGLRAIGDDSQIKRNREELVSLLEKAGVKVELWPPAQMAYPWSPTPVGLPELGSQYLTLPVTANQDLAHFTTTNESPILRFGMSKVIVTGMAQNNREAFVFTVESFVSGGFLLNIRYAGDGATNVTGAGVWPSIEKAKQIAEETAGRLLHGAVVTWQE